MYFSLVQKRWGAICSAQAFVAVAAGAFGAHGLKHWLDEQHLAWWQTACQYLMYHGLAGLILLVFSLYFSQLMWSVRLFVYGSVCFSGSLYLMAVTDIRMLGAVTPVGGVLYLTGWLMALRGFLKWSKNPVK